MRKVVKEVVVIGLMIVEYNSSREECSTVVVQYNSSIVYRVMWDSQHVQCAVWSGQREGLLIAHRLSEKVMELRAKPTRNFIISLVRPPLRGCDPRRILAKTHLGIVEF